MSEHLTDVKLANEQQEERAAAIRVELVSWFARDKAARLIVHLQDKVAELEQKIETCGLQCSATMKSLVAENERLRTTLTGISTCSTCEACRGAALMALDPLAAIKLAYLADEGRVERELGAPSTTGEGQP